MPIHSTHIILQTEYCTVQVAEDGPVLSQPATRTSYRINETSRRIWELVERPTSFGDLCDRLVAEFEVERAECEAHAGAFLRELRGRGLVEVMPAAPGPEAMRGRYLELLKRALVNLIYVEHEMRMEHLSTRGSSGEPLEDARLLRDIRYRHPERYDVSLACKMLGASFLRRTPPFTSSAHTLIGLKRLDNIEYCARRVFADGVAGDFLEAGVCQGGATILMRALQVAFDEAKRRVWVADSFQGVPPPEDRVDRGAKDLSEPHVPWLAIGLRAVQDNFRTYDLLDEGVRFLPGWFAETLPQAPVEQLAILRVDADLYRSTRDVLDTLYDKVAPGGFVIIDDYPWPPCREAVDSFRAERAITARLRHIDCDGVFWRKEA